MQNLPSDSDALQALALHLAGRREQILAAWRKSVNRDSELSIATSIARNQFVDHIPAVLDAFERRLCAEDTFEKNEAVAAQREQAAEHGLHRWQQGYDLTETMREWGHLHACLLLELERYSVEHPQVRSGVMHIARSALVRLCSDGVCASANRYVQLQQAEAASRVSDLQAAVAQLKALEVERAQAWREAAHDLRGSAQVIANASAALGRGGMPPSTQVQFSDILRANVASLNHLLSDLMDHARLEAGQERRNVTSFDVAARLREFCESMRHLAAERNLFLKAEGAQSLPVEGDPVKVLRIVQNLVLNALKATEHGGIRVTWEAGAGERAQQWILCVQDTGPGFKAHSAGPLAQVLKHATRESHAVEERAQAEGHTSDQTEPAPTLASRTTAANQRTGGGEGIGLSIVKRLCELLDASLELETAAGEGTTFRVILPRHYPGTPDQSGGDRPM